MSTNMLAEENTRYRRYESSFFLSSSCSASLTFTSSSSYKILRSIVYIVLTLNFLLLLPNRQNFSCSVSSSFSFVYEQAIPSVSLSCPDRILTGRKQQYSFCYNNIGEDLAIYLFIYLFIYLSINRAIYLSICPSIVI